MHGLLMVWTKWYAEHSTQTVAMNCANSKIMLAQLRTFHDFFVFGISFFQKKNLLHPH